jgi:hypothetical protein
MRAESKIFLEANRLFVESYSQEQPPRQMAMRDMERLLNIVRTELGVSINPDLWCGECRSSFVLNAYALYDEYLKNEKGE